MRAWLVLCLVVAVAGCGGDETTSTRSPGYRIAGRIALEGESDPGGVAVALTGGAAVTAVSAADGSFVLEKVPRGAYRLQIEAPGYRPLDEAVYAGLARETDVGLRTLSILRAAIRGNATADDLDGDTRRIQRRGGVSVTVEKIGSARSATVATEGGVSYTVVSADDGAYTINDAPAGTYKITAEYAGAEPAVQEVRVEGDGDVTAEPVVLQPLTGFFAVSGALADGSTSSIYTASPVVALRLSGFGAMKMRLGTSVDGTAAGCSLGSAEAYAATRAFTLAQEGPTAICVTYLDAAGRETAPQIESIVYDATPPSGAGLAINGGAGFSRSTHLALSLSALDAGSGVTSLQISRDPEFGGAVVQDFTPALVYPIDATEGSVTLWARYRDGAGNYGAPVSATVVVDTTPPVISLLQLEDGAGRSLTLMNQTRVTVHLAAADANPLEMLVANRSDLRGGVWLPYQEYSVWDLPLPADPAGESRTVYMRVRDAAGHETETRTAVVTLDTLAPASPTLTLAPGQAAVTHTTAVRLLLGATGAATVELAGEPGFAAPVVTPYATLATFSVAPGDGARTIYARFVDAAGNRSAVAQTGLTLDQTAPAVVSLVIDNGAAKTASPTGSVTLNLFALDNAGGAGIAGMRLGNGPLAAAAAPLQPFSLAAAWTLAAPLGDGVDAGKTVCAVFTDGAGNASSAACDGIGYDRLAPTGTVAFGTALTNATLLPVALAFAADTAQMKLSAGAACAGGSWVGAAALSLWPLPGIDGVQWVSALLRDDIGNESACYAAAMTLDTTGPVPSRFTLTGNGLDPAYTNTADIAIGFASTTADCARAELAEDPGFLYPSLARAGCSASALGYTLLGASPGYKTLYLRFIDGLGNAGPATAQSITYVPPTSDHFGQNPGFTLVNGPYTNQPVVALAMRATNASHMRVSETGACDAPWRPFSAAYDYALVNTGNGAHTLAVQFGDAAGNQTACFTQALTLDSVPPSFTARVSGAEGVPLRTAQTIVEVSLENMSSDAVEMVVSPFASFVGATWEPLMVEFPHVLMAGDGDKTVYLKVRDRAGNSSDVVATVIALDQTGPEAPGLQVADITGDGFPLSSDSVELRWTTPTDPHLAAFELQRFVIGSDDNFVALATQPPGESVFVDAVNATAGRLHHYRIRALDDLGTPSAWSIIASATPILPVTTVSWVQNGSGYRYFFNVFPGTFNLSGTYSYEDVTGTAYEVSMNWASAWQRPRSTQLIYNERLTLKSANQDNSLVYETGFPLRFNVRELVQQLGGDTDNTYAVAKVDNRGAVHVVAFNQGNAGWVPNVISYASNASGQWRTQDLNLPITYSPSLAVDRAGRAYVAAGNQYATNASGVWETYAYDPTAVAYIQEMAFDSLGNLHVVYKDSHTNPTVLKYATNAGGSWASRPLGSSGDSIVHIAVDSTDRVHIVYDANGDFYHTVVSGATMSRSLVAHGYTYVYRGGMAIDDADALHFVFADYTTRVENKILYATNATGGWALQKVVGTLAVTTESYTPSIDVDRTGCVRVAYVLARESGEDDLWLATRTPAGWDRERRREVARSYPSVRTDRSDRLHLVYAGAHQIWHESVALRPDDGFVVVDSVPHASPQRPVLKLSQRGEVHVNYYSETSLYHAVSTDGTWVTSLIAAPGGTSMGLELASSFDFDREGDPTLLWVRYDTSSGYSLDIAEPVTAGGWSSRPYVEGLSAASNAIAFDGLGVMHTAFPVYLAGTWRLRYIRGMDEPLDLESMYTTNLSLRLDSQNAAHLVYTTHDGYLIYATNQSGAWVKTTVDDYVGNRNGTNLQTSLALDDSGHLHVSYAPPWFSILRYATNASGAWVIETVDDFGETGQYSSLGVDHQGVVTVAYTDFTNNRVKLAQRGSTGWRRYDMAQGDGSSVFVDNYGQAHLAVSDRETLRYIKNVAGELRAESVRLVKPY